MSLARVKQFKDIELSYESAAAVTLTLYTDMPGGSLALRNTLTFPAASSRHTKTLPLDGTEGTLYYVSASSTGVVRLYGGLIRVRGVGVYIDGAAGEVWTTQPSAIGMQG